MRTVSGTFYRSFDEDQNRGYWTFLPTELNLLDIRIDQDITDLLVQAHRALGILQGMTKYISNVEDFLEMMIALMHITHAGLTILQCIIGIY